MSYAALDFRKPSLQELTHYGTPRHSGRYPWGSGENPYQHTDDFLSAIKKMSDAGATEKEIAKEMGLTTTQLRVQKSLANEERRAELVNQATELKNKGYSNTAIAERMGYDNESSVRNLLNQDIAARQKVSQKTADVLRDAVDEKGMIDIGTGVERELGVSREKLKEASYILEREGYEVYKVRVPQVTNPGNYTTTMILAKPGTEYKEAYQFDKVGNVFDYHSEDGGDSFVPKWEYPKSLDSSRLAINYGDQTGREKDGLIELRRGVEDISLGNSNYAQVRIMVDGTHYIKGLAVYSDNMPDGVDVVFNTNKTSDKGKLGVLKPIKDDPDNPFGSLIKEDGGQRHYFDENGNQQLSVINKTRETNDWSDWKDRAPAQFLSKQPMKLVKSQLNLSIANKRAEYDEICQLENPTLKKYLLSKYAEECDSDAVSLQAAALPRQKYKVLIPVTSMKDDEVYAPTYNNGEKLALIRYPHGGTFEIPIVTVNNKNPDAKSVIGEAPDAIGINHNVADRLSGADFDGDTVMAIPTGNGRVNIKSTHELKGLEGFDPKLAYPGYEGMKVMTNANKQHEMGNVSNLISDMTIKGAPEEDLAKAVRHSMVVIDAEKHELDYKRSYKDNDIALLKKKWQGTVDEETGKYSEGASTLITRANSEMRVTKRKGQPWINEDTGALEWERINPKTGEYETKTVHETYIDKKGQVQERTVSTTPMAETSDAYTLTSGPSGTKGEPVEAAYAQYANTLKAMANTARKEMLATEDIKQSPEARKIYEPEVKHLEAQLNESLLNAPKERKAQMIANVTAKNKINDNENMSKSDKKKVKQQALVKARESVGAKRKTIDISDREWEAIQAGAVSKTLLNRIFEHTDIDKVRERATPKKQQAISSSTQAQIRAYAKSGYTIADIAKRLGISTSTVSKYLK